jgi:hypothetical protein
MVTRGGNMVRSDVIDREAVDIGRETLEEELEDDRNKLDTSRLDLRITKLRYNSII